MHLTNLAVDFRIDLTTTQNSRSRPDIHSIVRTPSRNVRAINLLSTPCIYRLRSIMSYGPANTRSHQHNARYQQYRNNQGILYDINPNCSIAKVIVEYMIDKSLEPMFRSVINLELSSNKLGPGLGREGLGALDGGTDGTVDDKLGKNTKSTRNTEENSVEVLLSETVVLEEDTGVLQGSCQLNVLATLDLELNLRRQRWGRGSWSCRAR